MNSTDVRVIERVQANALARIDGFVSDSAGDGPALRQARMIVVVALAVAPIAAFFCLVSSALGRYGPSAAFGLSSVIAIVAPLTLRAGRSTALCGHMVMAAISIGLLAGQYTTGGLASPASLWVIAVPAIALGVAGRESAPTWAVMAVLDLVLFYALERVGYLPAASISSQGVELMQLTSMGCLLLVLLALGLAYEPGTEERWTRAASDTACDVEVSGRLTAIIDGSTDAIITADADGRIRSFNPAAEQIWGYSADEVVGENVSFLMPASDRSAHDIHLEHHRGRDSSRVLGKQRYRRIDDGKILIAKRKNGETFPIELGVSTVDLVEGAFLVGIARDISDRVEMEERLARQKAELSEKAARLAAIIDASTDAIITADADGRIRSFNPAAEKIWGHSMDEAVGKNVSFLMPALDRSTHDTHLEHHRSKDSSRVLGKQRYRRIDDGKVLVAQRKNGDEFPIELGVSTVKLADRTFLVGIARDISERVELEERLVRHQAELSDKVDERTADLMEARLAAEAANAAKSEFLANVSHELRTPLHAVLSFSSIGMKKTPQGRARDYFEKIHASGDRLLGLTNRLLDLSKLEVGDAKMRFERTDVRTLISTSIEALDQSAGQSGVSVISTATEVDLAAIVDRRSLGQVVQYLTENAIKYSAADTRVEIKAAADRGSLTLTVADRGVGVPEAELDTIFDRFTQSSRTCTGAGGTGLGLTLCRSIVEAHGGTIRAEPREGGGTIFTVHIPQVVSSKAA